MLKHLALAFVCLTSFSTLQAATSDVTARSEFKDTTEIRQKLALEILEVTETRALIQNIIAQSKEQMGQSVPSEYREAATKVMEQALSWENFSPKILAVHTEIYTAEELHELLTFYKSKLGQKMIAKQPEISRKTMELMQELMTDIKPIMEKELEKAKAAADAKKSAE